MNIFAWEKKGVISNSKRLKNLVSGRDEGSHDAKQFARLVIRYSLPFIVFIKSISAVLINMHNDMNRQAQPNPLFRSACKKYQNYEHPLYIFKTRTDLKEKYLGTFGIQTMYVWKAKSFKDSTTLTPNRPLAHTSFTYRKLNIPYSREH